MPTDKARLFDKVWAVIVAYHPDGGTLNALCKALQTDGVQVLVIDNTETPELSLGDLPAGTRLNSLGENTGIAHAQNVGIETALEGGAQAVLFLDQDSSIGTGFVRSLIGALTPGLPDIVSPRCIDADTEAELPSESLTRFGFVHPLLCGDSRKPCPTDIVISSGTVATREAIMLAGVLDEDLFIDFVDTEWCLRCRSKQIPIRVVPDAVLFHRIGNQSIKEGALTIMLHGPTRCYYQVRNSIHLFRKRHVPLIFSIRTMLAVLLNRFLLLRHISNRGEYIRAYTHGLRDGLAGVVGIRPHR